MRKTCPQALAFGTGFLDNPDTLYLVQNAQPGGAALYMRATYEAVLLVARSELRVADFLSKKQYDDATFEACCNYNLACSYVVGLQRKHAEEVAKASLQHMERLRKEYLLNVSEHTRFVCFTASLYSALQALQKATELYQNDRAITALGEAARAITFAARINAEVLTTRDNVLKWSL